MRDQLAPDEIATATHDVDGFAVGQTLVRWHFAVCIQLDPHVGEASQVVCANW